MLHFWCLFSIASALLVWRLYVVSERFFSNHFACSRRYLLVLLLLIVTKLLWAQTEDPGTLKFGKITEEDRQLLVAPGDSTADAYVLYDLRKSRIEPTTDGQPILKEYTHRRLKLLKESSFSRADIEIVYEKDGQKILNLEAAIHLPTGGAIKLKSSDFIRESYDDSREIIKFTFPGVVVGAIIEYTFTRRKENIIIPTRYIFQEDIPVRWAEYQNLIPIYFNYVSLGHAGQYFIDEVKRVNEAYGSQRIDHTYTRWAMRDLPAFKTEAYVNNLQDYLPQVALQLRSVSFPYRPVQMIFSDWQETTKSIHEIETFGKAYTKKGNYNRVWQAVEPLLAGKTEQAAIAQILYQFVTSRISWDGSMNPIPSQSPNSTFDQASGSSADLSMLLLALLTEAGIEADPLLVPLRDEGSPIELYPILTQFDHLMVLAKIDGQAILLDPNDKNREMGLPRIAALNHRAFVASPDNPRWIDINAARASQAIMADIYLDEEGVAQLKMKGQLKTYFAVDARGKIAKMTKPEELPLLDEIVANFPESEYKSHEVEEQTGSAALNIALEASAPIGQVVDDYCYLQPILSWMLDEGLADTKERLYPVDFAFPWQKRYIATIHLPDNFVVEDMPASIRLTSDDQSVECLFACELKANNTISLNFTTTINRTVFQAGDYKNVRDFFRRILDLQESIIVLKKTSK